MEEKGQVIYPEIIRKRNGTPVPFDAEKIRNAIRKANIAAQVEAISPLQFQELVDEVIRAIPKDSVPEVEQVQDIVEEAVSRRRRRPTSSTGLSTRRCANPRRIW